MDRPGPRPRGVVAAEVTEFYDQPAPFKYAPYAMLAVMVIGIVVRMLTRNRVAAVEQSGVTPEAGVGGHHLITTSAVARLPASVSR